jgi:hypothetical protein
MQSSWKWAEAWGTCPYCEKFTRQLAFRRRGCAYADERSNWLLSCLACWEDDNDYWHDMWADYYSGLL